MKQIAYRPYKLWYMAEAARLALIGGGTYICFDKSIVGVVTAMVMLGYIGKRDYRQQLHRQRLEYVNVFCDVIQAVSSGVGAGRSLEHAFAEASAEVCRRDDVYITIKGEWRRIIKGIECNQSLESLMKQMGDKSGITEIKQFVSILNISKRYGGDVLQLIRSFGMMVSRKRILNEELNTMISEKRLESNIMLVMPYMLVMYVRAVNPGYLDIVYTSMAGHILMLAVMVVLFAAYVIQGSIISKIMTGV